MNEYMKFEDCSEHFPLAMAYVPWQERAILNENLEDAFCNGSIFPGTRQTLYWKEMREMMRAKNDRERMLCDISIVSFTVVELTLYLDTHSDDKRAQEYFNHYIRMLNRLEKDYAMKYGPLNLANAGENCDDNWRWANMPMPWEGVC